LSPKGLCSTLLAYPHELFVQDELFPLSSFEEISSMKGLLVVFIAPSLLLKLIDFQT
jgi:hypothetical protein